MTQTERLLTIAKQQRTLLICAGLMIVYIVLNLYVVYKYFNNDPVLVTPPPPILSLILLVLFWLPIIVSVISMFILLKHIYENLIVAIFIPLVMIFCPHYLIAIIILAFSMQASKHLRTHGIRAGIFGTSLTQFGE